MGVDQHRLRRLERPAGGEVPAEFLRRDAHHRPELSLVAGFHLGEEVAGVDEVHGVHLSLVLGGGVLG